MHQLGVFPIIAAGLLLNRLTGENLKSASTTFVLMSLLTGFAFSAPVLADQAQADCEVHEHGDRKNKQSGPC